MVKCPNCGSTAQVEFDDYIDDFCGTIQAHYNCGCGCHFHISHYAGNDVDIDSVKRKERINDKMSKLW